jgi:predicted MFS family arabinose efflux permease
VSDSGRDPVLRTIVPGAAMIAVTFGLARYGYGLLLPDMQAGLHLDASTAGLIASGAYVSYLVANFAVVWLTTRFGPRCPIGLAAALAAGGMVVIALAGGALGLGVGVLVAGAAAGLAFPPYADVVATTVPPSGQAIAWSAISSGTGWGVALAGPVAVLFGARWRLAWLVFAAVAVVVGTLAVRAAPRQAVVTRQVPRVSWSWLICPRSRPLLVSSTLVGLGSSVWWAFSVDALRAGGLGETAARAVYAACGAAGVLASASGLAIARSGLRPVYLATCVLLAAAFPLLGLATSTLGLALVAAVLFGVSYNSVIAAQGLWSAGVFAQRPSAGLAAVNTALTIGTIAGPAIGGLVIDRYGYFPALVGAAAVTVLAMSQLPGRAPAARPEIEVRR